MAEHVGGSTGPGHRSPQSAASEMPVPRAMSAYRRPARRRPRRGIDPRPVVPRDLTASAAVRHRFTHHTLDGAVVRAALLDLVVQLGLQLRHRSQAARALTLTLRFAGGTTSEKTRRLTEPSAHEEDLAYQLMDAAVLQRARLAGIVLKGEDLIDADQVAEQISLDGARESRLVAEQAMGRIRRKFEARPRVGGADVGGQAIPFAIGGAPPRRRGGRVHDVGHLSRVVGLVGFPGD
ncbi:DinB/UmuC family translesion DNA polymerase [Streptomyces flaveolus]|uniref:DinB/UmuC family translesion DNA polymerase n=1 Tax=Streptomyces flaveolus TaxID=67297 RepID=UPI00340CAEEE